MHGSCRELWFVQNISDIRKCFAHPLKKANLTTIWQKLNLQICRMKNYRRDNSANRAVDQNVPVVVCVEEVCVPLSCKRKQRVWPLKWKLSRRTFQCYCSCCFGRLTCNYFSSIRTEKPFLTDIARVKLCNQTVKLFQKQSGITSALDSFQRPYDMAKNVLLVSKFRRSIQMTRWSNEKWSRPAWSGVS